MKLVLDENLSPLHVSELRLLGHDACGVMEVGLSGATAERVRRFAIETGRVLVTLDADFANVLRFSPEQTAGIVRLKIGPTLDHRSRALVPCP